MSNIIDYTRELELLREGDRSSNLFNTIITKAQPQLDRVKTLYERYINESVPIQDRCVTDVQAINNKINNDFFSEIVDTKVGYFSGNPQTYVFPDNDKSAKERFEYVRKRNRLDDLASETTKVCAICGYSARLVYINPEGEEALANINPWEVICLGEKGIDEPEFAFRVYTVEDLDGNTVTRLELHEPYKITFYEGAELGTEFNEYGTKDTPFHKCSLYCYENNSELQGDAEKVLSLIDAYDKAVSDYSSELEGFRSAYLALWGVDPFDEEGVESSPDFTQSGTLYLKSDQYSKQDAKFITKTMQVDIWKEFLDRTTDNIYRFSKTPNMKEESLGTAASGVALKFRLYPLENKTSSFERKVVSGNIRMLECLADAFAARGIYFDPYDVDQLFTRNIPIDLESEMRFLTMAKGYLPDEDLYSQLSFVKDPKDLIERLNKQKEEEEDVYKDVSANEQLLSGIRELSTEQTTTGTQQTEKTINKPV